MAAKQNTMPPLGWAALMLGAGYLLYKKVLKPGVVIPLKTKQYVERLRLGKLTNVKLSKDSVTFDFGIENPNSQPMTISSIVGDVFVSDGAGKQTLKLGTINHFGTDAIRPNAASKFQLIATIKLVNEFIYLSQVLGGKWKGTQLLFSGTVNANGRPWPVKQKVTLA